MAAKGMGGKWGYRTENDPSRQVSFDALAGAVASKLHYDQGRSAQDIASMHPDEFSGLAGHAGIDQNKTAQLMRAYEHYTISTKQ